MHSYLETAFADAAEFDSNLSPVLTMMAGHEGESAHGKPLSSPVPEHLLAELVSSDATNELALTAAGPGIEGAAAAANTAATRTQMRVFAAFLAAAMTARERTVAAVAM